MDEESLDRTKDEASCSTDDVLHRTLTMKSEFASTKTPEESGATTHANVLTLIPFSEQLPSRSRQRSGQYLISFAWASNYYLAQTVTGLAHSASDNCGEDRQKYMPRQRTSDVRISAEDLSTYSRFGRQIFEASSHIGQGFRRHHEVAGIDVVKEVTSNTLEMDRPCGPHLGHSPRCELRDISSSIRRTRRLGYQTTRLESIHQPGCAARGKIGRARKVRHSQLAIGSLGEVHDRGVLARCKPNAPDQVTVEESRKDFQNSHLCSPERILIRGQRFDSHSRDFNLLRQATSEQRLDATSGFENHYLIKYRTVGANLSNISREHLQRALNQTEIVCVQNLFNLADQSAFDILHDCTW
jgi:hypothetical protein